MEQRKIRFSQNLVPGTGLPKAACVVRRENRPAQPIRARRSMHLQPEAGYLSATQPSFVSYATQPSFVSYHKLLALDGQVHTCPRIFGVSPEFFGT